MDSIDLRVFEAVARTGGTNCAAATFADKIAIFRQVASHTHKKVISDDHVIICNGTARLSPLSEP